MWKDIVLHESEASIKTRKKINIVRIPRYIPNYFEILLINFALLCAPVLTPHMTGLPCEPGAVTENWSVSQRVSPLDAVENI